jgi:hypothetical protein
MRPLFGKHESSTETRFFERTVLLFDDGNGQVWTAWHKIVQTYRKEAPEGGVTELHPSCLSRGPNHSQSRVGLLTNQQLLRDM